MLPHLQQIIYPPVLVSAFFMLCITSADHLFRMSQEQPRRPEEEHQGPVKYGDVFNVSGELASKPITHEDANIIKAAVTRVFGEAKKGGPAAAMQAAAVSNEQAGFVLHTEADDIAGDQVVTMAQTDVPGARFTTEFLGGQVVGQFVEARPVDVSTVVDPKLRTPITIGEALEVAALTPRADKPVDQRDAAAIQAAEIRASGSNLIIPGGLSATANAAATNNATVEKDEDKIKLAEILAGAKAKLPVDKGVTREDAEEVAVAELRNDANVTTNPGTVAAAVASAARLNEKADF